MSQSSCVFIADMSGCDGVIHVSLNSVRTRLLSTSQKSLPRPTNQKETAPTCLKRVVPGIRTTTILSRGMVGRHIIAARDPTMYAFHLGWHYDSLYNRIHSCGRCQAEMFKSIDTQNNGRQFWFRWVTVPLVVKVRGDGLARCGAVFNVDRKQRLLLFVA